MSNFSDEINKKTPMPVMDYLGVAKCEIKVEHEEKVKDGWVKLTRDVCGNVIQKHGKEVENEYLKNAEKQDEINKANAILIRHEKYNEYDRELYYTDYINSWDKVEESESENSSEEEEEEEEEEFDDEQGDY